MTEKAQEILLMGDITEVPENGHVVIKTSSPQKVTESVAQLKCIYTNEHNMSNKQEELEATVQQENEYSCHHRNMVG